MKTVSQVLRLALLRLEEKYHQKQTAVRAGEDPAPPPPPASQTETQREVLRRFMHSRG